MKLELLIYEFSSLVKETEIYLEISLLNYFTLLMTILTC